MFKLGGGSAIESLEVSHPMGFFFFFFSILSWASRVVLVIIIIIIVFLCVFSFFQAY